MTAKPAISALDPRWVLMFLLAISFWTTAGEPIDAHEQEQERWLGKKVVQRVASLTLKMNDEPVEIGGKALRIYLVEEVDETSLLLKSLSQAKLGWARARDVIAVDQAVDYFSREIERHPTDAFAFAMLGLLREDRQEHDLAIANYNDAIRLDPRSAANFAGRASAFSSKREFDRAIADFDCAIRLDPKSALSYAGRGQARAAKSQYTQAIGDFSEAIWLDPLLLSAYVSRGRAWQSKQEYGKAIVDYNLALRLDPSHLAIHRLRAHCWEGLKSYRKAVGDYDEALRIDPKDVEALREKAWLLASSPDREIRDSKLAVLSATRACELTEWKSAALLESLAAVCAATGDFESAVKWQLKSNALARGPLELKEGEARLKRYRDKSL
jgi:tetratricopeptide (TPR) repeat protein